MKFGASPKFEDKTIAVAKEPFQNGRTLSRAQNQQTATELVVCSCQKKKSSGLAQCHSGPVPR